MVVTTTTTMMMIPQGENNESSQQHSSSLGQEIAFAIQAIRDQKFRDYIVRLRVALTALRSAVNEEEENSSDERSHSLLSFAAEPLLVVVVQDPPVLAGSRPLGLYNRFFSFASDDQFTGRSEENLQRASAVLLYNAALSYHILALQQQQQQQQRSAQKALRFYDMVLEILQGLEEMDQDVKLLTCAIVYNKASLFLHVGETEQLLESMCWLQSVLLSPEEEADDEDGGELQVLTRAVLAWYIDDDVQKNCILGAPAA